jgi:predicted histidine transporter YuiF (NhaC family)
MFVALTAFCVAAFLFTVALRRGTNETLALVIVATAGLIITVGIGALFRSVLIAIVLGIPLAIAIWFFLPSPMR